MNWSSISRRCFLFMTGGLFAKLGLDHAAVEADDRVLSAGEILERMATAYAKCKTYQDSGCVMTIFVRNDGEHTDRKPFSTAFVRPTRFRFEFKSSHDGQKWHRYIVWADGADVRTWVGYSARGWPKAVSVAGPGRSHRRIRGLGSYGPCASHA